MAQATQEEIAAMFRGVGASPAPANAPVNQPVGVAPPDQPPGGGKATPEEIANMFAGVGAKPEPQKPFIPPASAYEHMPVTDVALSAAANIPGELKRGVSGVAQGIEAIYNDPKGVGSGILRGIGNAFQGAKATYLRNTEGNAGGANFHNLSEDDISKSDALIHGLKEEYGTLLEPGGFKRAFANKPLGTMMNLAAPFQLTGGALAKGAGTLGTTGALGTTGKVIGTVGSAVKGVGDAIDPIQNAIRLAKIPVEIGKHVIPVVQTFTSGGNWDALKKAVVAGQSSNPALRDAFRSHMSGASSPSDIVSSIRNAAGAIGVDRSSAYIEGAKKVGIRGAAPGTLPTLSWTPIENALQEARGITRQTDPATGLQRIVYTDADKVLDTIQAEIAARKASPNNSIFYNLEGFDGLKKYIGQYQFGPGVSGVQKAAVTKLRQSVVDSITSKHPDYAKVMGAYESASRNLDEIAATFGTGSRSSDSAALAKMVKEYKKNGGGDLLKQLAAKDPTIPFRLAGHALNSWMPGGIRAGLNAATAWGATSAISPVLIPFQAASSSPRAMGNLNYYAAKALKVKPPGVVTQGAYRVGQGVSALQPPEQSSGGRIERKEGGKVSDAAQHELLVGRLMGLADKAKRGESATTKPLLNAPDEAIVKALSIANAAI